MSKEKLRECAGEIERIFHVEGYLKLSACLQRGHIIIKVDGEILARYTSAQDAKLHLSYRNHNSKWEPMPFAVAAENPTEAAHLVLQILMPHIQALSM